MEIRSFLDSYKIVMPIVLILFFSILHAVVKDLKYLDSHEWVKVEGNSATVGIIESAQDHLGDVVYVKLLEVGAPVSHGSSFGAVVKATSDINSSISGKLVEVTKSSMTPLVL